MIFVGDMFQLPPVVKQGLEKDLLKDLYHTDDFFFYKSDVIKRMRLVKIEFQKVYRQDDEHFLHILENVRMNKVTPEDIMHLNGRVHTPSEKDGAVITLASINKTADKINIQRLEEIEAEEFVYEGTIDGNFEEKCFPVELKLRLKVGAQVMFTRNDQQKRWAMVRSERWPSSQRTKLASHSTMVRPTLCLAAHGNRTATTTTRKSAR